MPGQAISTRDFKQYSQTLRFKTMQQPLCVINDDRRPLYRDVDAVSVRALELAGVLFHRAIPATLNKDGTNNNNFCSVGRFGMYTTIRGMTPPRQSTPIQCTGDPPIQPNNNCVVPWAVILAVHRTTDTKAEPHHLVVQKCNNQLVLGDDLTKS